MGSSPRAKRARVHLTYTYNYNGGGSFVNARTAFAAAAVLAGGLALVALADGGAHPAASKTERAAAPPDFEASSPKNPEGGQDYVALFASLDVGAKKSYPLWFGVLEARNAGYYAQMFDDSITARAVYFRQNPPRTLPKAMEFFTEMHELIKRDATPTASLAYAGCGFVPLEGKFFAVATIAGPGGVLVCRAASQTFEAGAAGASVPELRIVPVAVDPGDWVVVGTAGFWRTIEGKGGKLAVCDLVRSKETAKEAKAALQETLVGDARVAFALVRF